MTKTPKRKRAFASASREGCILSRFRMTRAQLGVRGRLGWCLDAGPSFIFLGAESCFVLSFELLASVTVMNPMNASVQYSKICGAATKKRESTYFQSTRGQDKKHWVETNQGEKLWVLHHEVFKRLGSQLPEMKISKIPSSSILFQRMDWKGEPTTSLFQSTYLGSPIRAELGHFFYGRCFEAKGCCSLPLTMALGRPGLTPWSFQTGRRTQGEGGRPDLAFCGASRGRLSFCVWHDHIRGVVRQMFPFRGNQEKSCSLLALVFSSVVLVRCHNYCKPFPPLTNMAAPGFTIRVAASLASLFSMVPWSGLVRDDGGRQEKPEPSWLRRGWAMRRRPALSGCGWNVRRERQAGRKRWREGSRRGLAEGRRGESGGLTAWGGREASVGDAAKRLQETEREVWAQARSGGMSGATQRNPSQRGCEGRASDSWVLEGSPRLGLERKETMGSAIGQTRKEPKPKTAIFGLKRGERKRGRRC
ncbi:hypothetical protein L345_04684, partial [Ophiophagus hannah]